MELDGRGDGIILEQIPLGKSLQSGQWMEHHWNVFGDLRKAMTCYGALVSGLSMIEALFSGPFVIIHFVHSFVLIHSYSELTFLS